MRDAQTSLRRELNLPLLILYGLGTIIGAGIYALLGDIASTAGYLAPWSFLVASAIAALTALSFAELIARYPQAGATALFIERGHQHRWLAVGAGLLLVLSAVASAAALLNALVGYVQQLIPAGRVPLIVGCVVCATAVALWGIKQTAWVVAVISLLEIGGVLWLTGLAASHIDPGRIEWSRLQPGAGDLQPVLLGATLAFYAYIGFEDMVEVAEEVKNVRRTLPKAILWTLCISSALYVVLMTTTLLAVSAEFLAASTAPFADIYRQLTNREPQLFLAIGCVAIINGVLVQFIMATRILYGLARRGELPAAFGTLWPATQTPVVATLGVGAIVLLAAVLGTLGELARITSILMLIVFALANSALWRIKTCPTQTQTAATNADPAFRVPTVIPLLAALTCVALATHALLAG